MSIEYVEIRNENRELVGIVDTARSIIWHSVYYGVGDFEIYAQATKEHMDLLEVGNYVTRVDNSEVGIIESINISFDAENGKVITAAGRFAKSILDRRLIYRYNGTYRNIPTTISGNVESAVRSLVANNAISSTDTKRNISELQLGQLNNLPAVIVDTDSNDSQKQADIKNLLEYTDSVLEEYEMSATILLDATTKKLKYTVFEGVDRSINNTDGNEPVIFSRELDNLSESVYIHDLTKSKNSALIGGEGQGISRFYTLIAPTATGMNRREVYVDASSVSRESGVSDAAYEKMLNTHGKQKLSTLQEKESFNGTIIVTDGNYILNEDFSLGDIVTIQDDDIGKRISARILETLETQDENGYEIEAVYA